MNTMPWTQAAAVAGGAAIGALARWRIGLALAASGAPFPLGTWVVNAGGGLLVGIAMAWLSRHSLLHLFWVTGVLGGFTTFSAFSAESLALVQRGQLLIALAHALAHVLGALVFTWIGFTLARGALRV